MKLDIRRDAKKNHYYKFQIKRSKIEGNRCRSTAGNGRIAIGIVLLDYFKISGTAGPVEINQFILLALYARGFTAASDEITSASFSSSLAYGVFFSSFRDAREMEK